MAVYRHKIGIKRTLKTTQMDYLICKESNNGSYFWNGTQFVRFISDAILLSKKEAIAVKRKNQLFYSDTLEIRHHKDFYTV